VPPLAPHARTFFMCSPGQVCLVLGVVYPSLSNTLIKRESQGILVVTETVKRRVEQLQLDEVVVLSDDTTAIVGG
jgi:hypothetical protein